MKTVLCIGRITNGAVTIDRPTLEERLAQQMQRNAELLQMNADLDALQAREVNSFTARGNLDELLDAIENDYEWIRKGC
jgi:hypothetical protein